MLDAGCGSGRLTLALAQAGARVSGFDTSSEALREARARATAAGVDLDLVLADMNEPLPFADRHFEAVTSRLSLMVARDPVATLREFVRVLVPGGRIATALWASLPANPWFSAPREAVAVVLGPERASFAGAFGRLGDTDESAAVHRAAGLADVEERLLRETIERTDAADHWRQLARDNGHFRRLDETLDATTRADVINELEPRLAPYRTNRMLVIPRTLVLVTARRPAT